MKDFFAGCWMIYMFLAFLFVAFGLWSGWLLWVGLVVGLWFAFHES